MRESELLGGVLEKGSVPLVLVAVGPTAARKEDIILVYY